MTTGAATPLSTILLLLIGYPGIASVRYLATSTSWTTPLFQSEGQQDTIVWVRSGQSLTTWRRNSMTSTSLTEKLLLTRLWSSSLADPPVKQYMPMKPVKRGIKVNTWHTDHKSVHIDIQTHGCCSHTHMYSAFTQNHMHTIPTLFHKQTNHYTHIPACTK